MTPEQIIEQLKQVIAESEKKPGGKVNGNGADAFKERFRAHFMKVHNRRIAKMKSNERA